LILDEDDDDFSFLPTVADYAHLVGKKYVFEDGDSLEIIQVKRRETGPWITFHTIQGPGIPRKQVMMAEEFMENFGHLFGLED
jgi:hypothetical protein